MSPAARRKDAQIRKRLAQEMELTVKALKYAREQAEKAEREKAEQEKAEQEKAKEGDD